MADAPGGYFGRALVVDVGTGSTTLLPLPEKVLRDHLGGVGLGAWLLHELAPAGVDPLAPEAPLAFVFSPLVGTPLTTSAKFAVVAKSPLTGMLTDALASSHFALAGKLTGHDAIVLVGAAARPSTVVVDGSGVRLQDATEIWGSTAAEAERAVKDGLGGGWQVASIGVAGERGVRFATVSHDGRHAGRGGLGAVMGAKRIKALAVRAVTKVAPADPAGVLAAARALRERSHGAAIERHREIGSMERLLELNALSALPAQNFQQVGVTDVEQLDPEELARARTVTRSGCASCSIGCERLYRTTSGRTVRLEHQSAGALGPMCGVSDVDVILAATALCDELGIDTISAGGTVAWAMECSERGLLDAPWLRFGDGPALLRALTEIGSGEGVGPLLSLGSRAAAAVLGQGSAAFAAHVKGLEMPGYEPRELQRIGLGLAVNARGADHNRSGAHSGELPDRPEAAAAAEALARATVEAEDQAAVMDSLILCGFLRGVFDQPFAEWAALLATVTGWPVDEAELRRTAHRIVRLKRVFNLREGWQPEDDWLPERFLVDEVVLADGRTAGLTTERLRTLVDAYWAARGLDRQGRPRVAS